MRCSVGLLAVACLGLLLACGPTDRDATPVLWYSDPAQKWEDALPLGNGRLGVMVYGDPETEHLQLNDDSLWPADLGWAEPEGTPDDLAQIRRLLLKNDHQAADRLFVEKFSNKKVVRSHQTLGDLHIALNHQNVSEYRRELDLQRALATVSYMADGRAVKERVFVSHPDGAVIMEIMTEAESGLNAKVRLSRPQDHGHETAVVSAEADNRLVMSGEVTQYGGYFDSKPVPIKHGVRFETCLEIIPGDGEVRQAGDALELVDVHRVMMVLVSASSYYEEDLTGANERRLAALSGKSFDGLLARHEKDFSALFNRVRLDLNAAVPDTMPTDQRLERVKNGSVDIGLESLLFDYGRYLLISCSRPGSNPANLQGLWNRHIEAPWNADYHLNINLQMNYWLANVTQLDELNLPLFDFIDRLIENGKVTARQNFGCGGAFVPHATDLWAPTWLRAPTAFWGCSVGAGGWMLQHYWSHFEFTQDTLFLKTRAFPSLEAVTRFYSDWLMEDPRDGLLVSAPSTSPENQFCFAPGKAAATCLGSAMDQQVIAEVFDHYIRACEILGDRTELLEKIRYQRRHLRPGFVIGSHGRLLEWDREYAELEPGHRHMSHLYGFHPGSQVSRTETPDIFEAVRRTLDYRLENGGAGTGWSRAWLINCSARLQDGNMAHEHIQLLLKKSIARNLFDMHPPFQIDGNFGYTAGVAEMLIQSHETGKIELLPALPDAWSDGEIRGLRARGGFIVDMKWVKGRLTEAVIFSDAGGACVVEYQKKIRDVMLNRGEKEKLRY